MPTATTSLRTSNIQWLIESRPAGLTWPRSSPPQPNQPPLDLVDHGPDLAEPMATNDRGVRVRTVKAYWATQPRQGLPDAERWSTTLALAVVQALLGQRSVAQLNRWMVEEVLAAISLYQRRTLRAQGRQAAPAALRSVHVQHPSPEVAEVSAHVVIDKKSAAMAFRLEALGDRWICTALQIGARPSSTERARG
jgi:hypothetical protein